MKRVPDWLLALHEEILRRSLTGSVEIQFIRGEFQRGNFTEGFNLKSDILRASTDRDLAQKPPERKTAAG